MSLKGTETREKEYKGKNDKISLKSVQLRLLQVDQLRFEEVGVNSCVIYAETRYVYVRN